MTHENIIQKYIEIKKHVVLDGWADEIEWQKRLSVDSITESYFLKEAAWVILSSGFRESVLRKKFRVISTCFCDWSSAAEIVNNKESCVECALAAFGNQKKIGSIIRVAEMITAVGFENFWKEILISPIENLQKLPYIGVITSFHLAKNLGIDIAKPDRHLLRISNNLGYGDDVNKLCQYISSGTKDSVAVVDLVLWRYATINPSYLKEFAIIT